MEKYNGFKEISPYEAENAAKLIGKDWMLITVSDGDGANAMTASWGCLGVLWGKPVAVCFIRPQRYTYELIEKTERISLAFLGKDYKSALNICGTKSGRDCDKLSEAGLHVSDCGGVPVISEARLTFVCRKLYKGKIDEAGFIDKSIADFYKNGDYHYVYVAEIEKTLIKE